MKKYILIIVSLPEIQGLGIIYNDNLKCDAISIILALKLDFQYLVLMFLTHNNIHLKAFITYDFIGN